MIKKVALLSLILFCSGLQAHQERIIQVKGNGELDGLPEQYQPANIDLKNRVIAIAKNEFAMPLCISKYFSFNEEYTLKISSSWYHKRTGLPPYINFKINPKDKDHAYSLLLGLDDLKVIEAKVLTYPKPGKIAFHTVAFDDRCLKAIENGYAKSNHLTKESK